MEFRKFDAVKQCDVMLLSKRHSAFDLCSGPSSVPYSSSGPDIASSCHVASVSCPGNIWKPSSAFVFRDTDAFEWHQLVVCRMFLTFIYLIDSL